MRSQDNALIAIKNLIRTILSFEKGEKKYHKLKERKEIFSKINIEINLCKKEDIFNVIKRHKLLGFIHNNKLIKYYLPSFYDEINKLYLPYFKKNLKQLHFLKQTSLLLKENNIKFIVFKGIPLSIQSRGSITERESGDIDIFVDTKNLNKTIKLLEMNGFKKNHKYLPNNFSTIWGKLCSFIFYELTFTKEIKGSIYSLDLHWKLSLFQGNLPSFEKAWDSSEIIKVNNLTINSLNRYHSLIHSCAHAAKDRWMSINSLLDIYFLKEILNEEPNKLRNIHEIVFGLIALSELTGKDFNYIKENKQIKKYIYKTIEKSQNLPIKSNKYSKFIFLNIILELLHKYIITFKFKDRLLILIHLFWGILKILFFKLI